MAKIRWGVGEFEPVLVKIDFCGDRNQERAGLASTPVPNQRFGTLRRDYAWLVYSMSWTDGLMTQETRLKG